jgi:serine/threonine protein kinase/Tfp pilus assembly protein PilE
MSHHNRCLSCMTPLSGASTCPSCGAQVGSEPDNPLYLPAGCLLNNRYLIGRVIGVGGFGIVYLAWDNNLDIKVAVKEYLPKEYAARASDHLSLTPYTGSAKDEYGYGMERFLDEAKALAKFQDHVGIVTVYESFRANNTAYMVMQYLDGITLKEFLKRQPDERISFDLAVKALTPIMDALREVHSAGYVHRDISPDNIFITRQKQVKLLDFGAARYAIGEHSKSLTSVLKHGYAPKEQYSTKGNQGPWTDVYAVAATLYRCVTGQVPPDAMERMQEADTIKSPKQLGIDVPLQGELALMKGLALRAADRFESVRDLQGALLGVVPVDAPKPVNQGSDLIEPRRAAEVKVVECPECGAKNQLQPGDDPGALRCGKCRRELGVNTFSRNNSPKPAESNSSIISTNAATISFKPISHKSFIWATVGGLFALGIGLLQGDSNETFAGIAFLVFFASWSFAYIYHYVALYRCWSVLQGSTARTTPGSAVVRLFIPFYNIYWIFVAYKGLAEDANRFAELYGLKSRISAGLSLAVCISMIVPYANIIIAPILFLFLIYQWSLFYEEVSINWQRLDIKSDTLNRPQSNNIGVIIAVSLGGLFIIGILAAIAIPQFSAYRMKAYNSAAISDCKNLKTTVEAYFADNQNYPESAQNINFTPTVKIKLGYTPNCKQEFNYSTYRSYLSCQGYTITSYHEDSERMYGMTSESAQVYYKLKKESENEWKPLQ